MTARRSPFAVALLLTAGIVTAAPPALATAAGPSVLLLGDSYASGEGLDTAEGACGRSPEAWDGALAATVAGATVTVLACSGAVVADVLVGDGSASAQLDMVDGRHDVVVLTIGGNDVGFTELLADCLGFAGGDGVSGTGVPAAGPGWVGLLERSIVDVGCDVTQQAMLTRVARLGDDDAFTIGGEGATTGGLAAVYERVAREALTDDGVLLVMGYPRLWEPSDAWPERYGGRCHGVRAADADVLAGAVTALDAVMRSAATRANEQLGAQRVVQVGVAEAFAGHGLCAEDAAWINGLSVVEGGVDVAQLLVQGASSGFEVLEQLDPAALEALGARPARAFHPDADGYRALAGAIAGALAP